MNKTANPSREGVCNWNQRVLAPWSKQTPLPARTSAPSGLRMHQAKLREGAL
jgi:hypothetical protein